MNKLYYPSSQIVPNLYTNGREFETLTGAPYVGFYHTYEDGSILTGSTYTPGVSIPLRKMNLNLEEGDSLTYNSVISDVTSFVAPKIFRPFPTLDDYMEGQISRYFCRRRNFALYYDIIEISPEQFDSYGSLDTGIDYNLYQVINLTWKLTGPLITSTVDGIEVPSISLTNKSTVELTDKILPGLAQYLTDYLELTVYSPQTPKEISEKFVTVG